jgi:hypothetical protein
MRNFPGGCLAVLFILTPPLRGFASQLPSETAAPTNLKMRVRVYNMARVAPRVLEESEQEVSRIFLEVGAKIEWLECPCAQNPSSADLMLRIIPQLFGSVRADFREDHLGFAPSSEDGGVLATIFFHRVEALTKGGATAPLLGNAIAHELGHLLLGSNAHSSTGIMQAHWNRELLKLANRGLLRFTPEQAALLRVRISGRT